MATLATAVFAERRPSWSHQPAEFPQAKPFEQILPYPKIKASWANQYDFRFVEGHPDFSGAKKEAPASAFSKLWIADRAPRKIDALSLMSMSDAFFARVFHARRELVPFGTVSLTTYFHLSAEDLAAEDIEPRARGRRRQDVPPELSATRTANCGRRAAACSRPPRQIALFQGVKKGGSMSRPLVRHCGRSVFGAIRNPEVAWTRSRVRVGAAGQRLAARPSFNASAGMIGALTPPRA